MRIKPLTREQTDRREIILAAESVLLMPRTTHATVLDISIYRLVSYTRHDEHLVAVPPEVIKRHTDFVRRYIASLQSHLETIEKGGAK